MSHNGSDLLLRFLSGDPGKVRSAAREMLIGYDEEVLHFLAPHADRIDAATARVDLGGGIVSHRTYLNQALKRLKALAARKCICTVLVGYDFASPVSERRTGLIEILNQTRNFDGQITEYLCQCGKCGQHYLVTENIGWHVPCYQWLPYSPPMEEASTA